MKIGFHGFIGIALCIVGLLRTFNIININSTGGSFILIILITLGAISIINSIFKNT